MMTFQEKMEGVPPSIAWQVQHARVPRQIKVTSLELATLVAERIRSSVGGVVFSGKVVDMWPVLEDSQKVAQVYAGAIHYNQFGVLVDIGKLKAIGLPGNFPVMLEFGTSIMRPVPIWRVFQQKYTVVIDNQLKAALSMKRNIREMPEPRLKQWQQKIIV